MADFYFSADGSGSKTASAGTAIVVTVPGRAGAYTHVTEFANTAGATAHTATFMRDVSYTTLSSAAAASQAVVNVTAALTDGGGNAIAAGDYVSLQQDDGTWHTTTFASAASLAYTLNDNLTDTAAAGNKIFCYGVIGDAIHDNSDYALASGGQTVLPTNTVGGTICRGKSAGAPVLIYNANASNASTVNYTMWAYSKK